MFRICVHTESICSMHAPYKSIVSIKHTEHYIGTDEKKIFASTDSARLRLWNKNYYLVRRPWKLNEGITYSTLTIVNLYTVLRLMYNNYDSYERYSWRDSLTALLLFSWYFGCRFCSTCVLFMYLCACKNKFFFCW